jgi:glycine cleavage system H protein
VEVDLLVPTDLLFTEDHQWARRDGDRIRIGLTEYAQKELGDVVFVDLPAVGQKVTANANMSTIESVKAVSDINSPVTGEVVEVNDELQYSPELVNQDPYNKGWIAVIEVSDVSELKNLLTPKKYSQHIKM